MNAERKLEHKKLFSIEDDNANIFSEVQNTNEKMQKQTLKIVLAMVLTLDEELKQQLKLLTYRKEKSSHKNILVYSESVNFSQLCLTFCNPMDCVAC